MSEYKDLKIDDVIVFYFASGYVNASAEEERTVAEITGAENQEQLERLEDRYIEKCFQEEYDGFLANQDSGWYKK